MNDELVKRLFECRNAIYSDLTCLDPCDFSDDESYELEWVELRGRLHGFNYALRVLGLLK